MKPIPEQILERLEFERATTQNLGVCLSVKSVKAIAPCEACGVELDAVRRVRIQRNSEPKPHWREYCYTCKLVTVAGEGDWQEPQQLNAKMRQPDFFKDK